jgi:hypothetical protein
MTVYYLKDANGNQFPVNATPIGPQPGASSLCVTPASDAVAEPGGAPITGAAMPAGGAGLTGWLSAIWKAIAGTLTVSDSQSAPFAGAVAMTPGTTYAAARSVGVLCTVAGNVEFQFPDTSTLMLSVSVGWQTFPFACTQILGAGTTATATYFNLK